VKMAVTDEKLKFVDFRYDRLWISFFFSPSVCVSKFIFVPVYIFFCLFLSVWSSGFLSIIPWMDRHLFGGGCHIFILFLSRKMEFHSCGMVPLSWDVCQPRFVHPSMDSGGPFSKIKRKQRHRPQMEKAKQRRKKKKKKKRLWLHRSALTLPSVPCSSPATTIQ
jgi:hypothetical protein